MQYEISLPADYDMTVIRRRVTSKGHLLDDFPGLGLKAFCIRERGVDGSPVNQYAPFYLWAATSGMNRFLWGGGGFGGIRDDFGRPPVRHWTGVACQQGPARTVAPRAASRRTSAIPADADPATLVEQALDELRQEADTPGVHTTVLAVDPRHWQLMHFTLWEHTSPETADTRYQVLHLCSPELADIAVGRHW